MKTKKKLQDLLPIEFENLTFDLIVAKGMNNVSWRTPGADGGRDIEGIVIFTDFAQSQVFSKWYVECKKYSNSVDWPTIYSKLAYADSNEADVLLMCTSSKYTPSAINEVERWNKSKKKPTIRLWSGHTIEIFLDLHRDIAMKYGLLEVPEVPSGSVLQLSLALSKSVSSYFSEIIFCEQTPTSMLEAAHHISQLLQKRMEDISYERRFKPAFFNGKDINIRNCTLDLCAYKIDRFGFSAFISYLTALTRDKISIKSIDDYSCKVISSSIMCSIILRYKNVFDAIALWSDFEYSCSNNELLVRQRKC